MPMVQPLHPPSRIDPATLEAYLATDYHILSEPPFIVKVGQFSQELSALHHRLHAASSALLTACNPCSRLLSEEENQRRQWCLLESIKEAGIPFITARGEDPQRQWPAENSLLLLGIEQQTAIKLGQKWQQNALLWHGHDAVPLLLLLR
ncbi:MAG: DUF3293 domain-containing protein [Magnetococcales bacterium]|nr:DUF3293 domain-containing protein [Magnetococcales bacterium]